MTEETRPEPSLAIAQELQVTQLGQPGAMRLLRLVLA